MASSNGDDLFNISWSDSLSKAVDLLKSGDCVGMPTETVYGLAGDALNPQGVARVFEIKRRPAFDPLIIHMTTDLNLEEYVVMNKTAEHLMTQFCPGPLTLLMEKTDQISDLVTSSHPTVAVRFPDHPLSQALINAYGGPLVAPSANRFGQLSPTSAEAVKDGLGDEVRLVLNGGSCPVGVESTIVNTTAAYPNLPVLRFGGIATEELEALGYRLSYPTPIIGQAPGTLKNHYAPKIPLYICEEPTHAYDSTRSDPVTLQHSMDMSQAVWLGWREHREDFSQSFVLSESGDLRQAAHRVFSLLREFSQMGHQMIVAELPPDLGLGKAIRDRLKRGASGYIACSAGSWYFTR